MKTNTTTLFIVACLLFSWHCKGEKPPVKIEHPDRKNLKIQDKWTVLNGDHSGKPLVVRLNIWAASIKGHPQYSQRVGIALPLRSASEQMPDLNAVEDYLFDHAQKDNAAIIVAIVTFPDVREFTLYYNDTTQLAPLLANLQKQFPQFQFQHYLKADPEWLGYGEFQQ
ncbi:DUF695 domain-containing protein [Leptospira yasudae]|uniref:DUF695 domain-containing protein n=1 Tax=Leptospira yasudae TaxID=2202201 RepID=A0ABX9M0M6_9LEPT|nr:hypothetical protein DLM77_17065 [Leptospira yasudae]TGK23565.1 DUF695 domain-containing protein [Leptospira yasudae]TGM01029.1 DUF695 domain-containing protein [Leptospira yasudae]